LGGWDFTIVVSGYVQPKLSGLFLSACVALVFDIHNTMVLHNKLIVKRFYICYIAGALSAW